MSTVLVTGGAGFIGSHLVDALVGSGERVRVLDNLDPLAHPDGTVPSHLSPEAEFLHADLEDPEAVATALEGVDRVFHLGGAVGNGESMMNVRRAVDANSGGTATLIEAILARRDQVRRLVVASSMVVYGEGTYRCPEHGEVQPGVRPIEQLRRRDWDPRCPFDGEPAEFVPAREDHGLRPISVYGITKRDQEELALVLGGAYGLEAVALRYLNVYGPRQALGNPYTGVAAIFAARILSGRRPLVFEDGGQIRDLVHVSDVVRATLAAMDSATAPGHAINVAAGRRIEIGELARLARAGAEPPGPRARAARRVPRRRHSPLPGRHDARSRAAGLRGPDGARGRTARAGRVGRLPDGDRARRRGGGRDEGAQPRRLSAARAACTVPCTRRLQELCFRSTLRSPELEEPHREARKPRRTRMLRTQSNPATGLGGSRRFVLLAVLPALVLVAALAPASALAGTSGGDGPCSASLTATQDPAVASFTVDCGDGNNIVNVNLRSSEDGRTEGGTGTTCTENSARGTSTARRTTRTSSSPAGSTATAATSAPPLA